MKRTIQVVGAIVIIALGAFSVRYYLQHQRAKKAGILSENIVHNGDTWTADVSARLPADEKAVFGAIEHVEDAPKYSDNIKEVKVISHEGNKKTVEMQMNGPGGQQLPNELQFEYFPDQKKITYNTVSNPLFSTNGEYHLTDEGGATKIDIHQITKMQMQMPLPDAVIRQLMRGIFVAQLEGIKKSLNITTADVDNEPEEEDEP